MTTIADIHQNQYESIRELTENEIDSVHGGVLPVLTAAYSLASGTAVRSVGGYIINRAASAYAIYSAAQYYGV